MTGGLECRKLVLGGTSDDADTQADPHERDLASSRSMAGVLQRLWKRLLRADDARRGIAWRWQVVENASLKAPLGGEVTGPNPTD